VGWYMFVWNDDRPLLQKAEHDELDLRTQFGSKQQRAANLDAYRAQIQLVGFGLLQHRPIVVPDEHVPAESCHHGKAEGNEESAHCQGPAAYVARIHGAKLIEKVHFAATFLTVVSPPLSTSTPTTSLVIGKLDPPTGESLADSTTCNCGLSIQDEESMLRMKVDTRVLD